MNLQDEGAGLGETGGEGEHVSSQIGPESLATTFPGDSGNLPLDTRRVLVQLLLGPSVDARRQSKLWHVLLRDEGILRSRLHELFLELVVDAEQQVAFTRQVSAEGVDAPILLRRAHLTFLESALLLFLRQRLTQADPAGERAVVSLQEMLEHVAVFERQDNTDKVKFEKQKANAVEKVKKLSLVRQLPGPDKRFEVSPTLKLLFSAEEIQALMRAYAQMSAVGSHEAEEAADPESAVQEESDE
jgi:hypothetical protein